MDRKQQRYIYHLKFDTCFYNKKGQEFQDFFADIMVRAFPENFQKVRPHGNEGDWKCDGYRKNDRTVFQCYAPSTEKLRNLLEKIGADFEGARSRWPGVKMRQWVFVYNSREGLPPQVVQKLDELERTSGIEVTSWEMTDLWEVAKSLTPDVLSEVLGPIPGSENMSGLGFEDLAPVVKSIKQSIQLRFDPQVAPPSPDKLKNNRLSDGVAGLLRLGRQSEKLVRNYFRAHSDLEFVDRIAEGLKEKYSDLKRIGFPPDDIFAELQRFSGGMDGDVSHQAAVLAVLSYFFERCDIFESGPTGGSQ